MSKDVYPTTIINNTTLQETGITIDTCDQGHKFPKLPDHPTKDGKARCPHCLAKELNELENDIHYNAMKDINKP